MCSGPKNTALDAFILISWTTSHSHFLFFYCHYSLCCLLGLDDAVRRKKKQTQITTGIMRSNYKYICISILVAVAVGKQTWSGAGSAANFAHVHARARRLLEVSSLQLIAAGRQGGSGVGGLSSFVCASVLSTRKRETPEGIIFVSSSSSAYLACLQSGKKGGKPPPVSTLFAFSPADFTLWGLAEQKASVGLPLRCFKLT